MMSLITNEDILKAIKLEKIGKIGLPVAWVIKKILRLDKNNYIYNKGKHLKNEDFLKYLIKELKIKYQIYDEDLKRIPKRGPFIIISNHPLGGIDGILLMYIIYNIRKDFKIMGNFLLHKIKPLSNMIIPVNPFDDKSFYNNLSSIKKCINLLNKNKCIGIFPAGEVSYKDKKNEILDIDWNTSIIKLIKKSNVPIIPVFFKARNSSLFYKLSKIHPNIKTAMLPYETVKNRKDIIKIRIGKPIFQKQQNEYNDIEEFKKFLRNKTYMLSSYYNIDRKTLKVFNSKKDIKIKSNNKTYLKKEEIISQIELNLILQDINNLYKKKSLLFSSNDYECFFTKYEEIPHIILEIGRLREITFREIGEGTNRKLDLDKFDKYYHHLILWDKNKKKIVGAYRIGLGDNIYNKMGIKGFYINELFHFDSDIHPFFKKCIEMGRAFIINEYQQKPMPLFLLWRGIIKVAFSYPNHKFIIGSVSISNKFSDFSKSLMIEFMKSNYFDSNVAKYIRAKKDFKIKLKEKDKEFIFCESESDLNKFDKLIDELEPQLRLPVLIKKYIKQNAKVIGFNVDPKFNDAIDGLMYIRISDIPKDTLINEL